MLRLQAVLGSLNSFIIQNGSDMGFANFGLIMESLTDELIEELDERDEASVEAFMAHMGEVIAWIGHGDDSRLPDGLRPFAEAVQGPVEDANVG